MQLFLEKNTFIRQKIRRFFFCPSSRLRQCTARFSGTALEMSYDIEINIHLTAAVLVDISAASLKLVTLALFRLPAQILFLAYLDLFRKSGHEIRFFYWLFFCLFCFCTSDPNQSWRQFKIQFKSGIGIGSLQRDLCLSPDALATHIWFQSVFWVSCIATYTTSFLNKLSAPQFNDVIAWSGRWWICVFHALGWKATSPA